MFSDMFSDIYCSFRDTYPNFYIIFISILVTIWFKGMARVIDIFIPNRDFKSNMLMMIIPALILYLGDGRLQEIYNFEGLPVRIAAISEPERKKE